MFCDEKIIMKLFGSSHGENVGITVEGLPEGFAIDTEKLKTFTRRRAPGKSIYTSGRKEADGFVMQGGLTDGKTDGTPLRITIANTDVRREDYFPDLPRPGHADIGAYFKYGGKVDMSGGGFFSGRMTAPLCVVGGIALQILAQKGIFAGAHIYEIHGEKDVSFEETDCLQSIFEEISKKDFPVISDECGEKMKKEIETASAKKDSVGGIVECAVTGLPRGLGGAYFERVESTVAAGLFSVPAVKGVEFGSGFGSAKLYGSENNDEIFAQNGEIGFRSDNHGGTLGGITTGMPLLVRAAIKPTPSIGMRQNTVSLGKMENAAIEISGRHDPCIVQRAVPVCESMTAIALLDIILRECKDE